MAVELEPNAYFDRAAATPDLPFTATLWLNVGTWVDGPAYRWSTIIYFGADSALNLRELYIDNDSNMSVLGYGGGVDLSTDHVGEETWVFLAMVLSSTGTFTLYWRFEGETALTSVSDESGTTFDNGHLSLGFSPDTTNQHLSLAGSSAYVRVFDSELSEAQVLTESESETAVLSAWAEWPMADTTGDDVSGNNRDLTPIEDGGSFTVVGDPQVADPPNQGSGTYIFDITMAPEGTGDYSGSAQYNLDLEMQGTGVAPLIPTGTGQFNLDFQVDNTGTTEYFGTGVFDLGLTMHGPETKGVAVVENIDLPGISEDLPYPIEVRLTLVDSNHREVLGYFTDRITGLTTIVPDHRFFLNLVTSQWSLPFLPTDDIVPEGCSYRRLLLIGSSIVAADYFQVPNDLEGPLLLSGLVLSLSF